MKIPAPKEIRRILSRIRAQGRRYAATYAWLIRDSIRTTPVLWWQMLIASAVSLGANAAVVGLIYGYVRLVENDAELSALGITVHPRESFLLLMLAVLGLLAVSSVLAISQYMARSSAIGAMGSFEKRCTGRAIALYQRLPDPRARRADEILQKKRILELARSDAMQCAMAIKFIGFGVQSLLMFLFAIGVMLVLDPQTTAIVCALGLIVVAAQYPSNLLAADSTAVITETRPQVHRGLTGLLNRAASEPRHARSGELERDIAAYFEEPVTKRHMKAGEDRFRAIEVSGLTMRFGSALILGGIIAAFGLSVLEREIDWATLLAYLALLRVALANVTAVFQTVTMFTRMYPQVQDFADFVGSASLAQQPLPARKGPKGDPIRLKAERLDGGSKTLSLKRGTLCALLAAPGYDREVAAYFQRALGFSAPGAVDRRIDTVDLAVAPPKAGETRTARDWRAEVTPALERLRDTGTDLILLDRRAMAAMQRGEWPSWRERLRDRVLILVYTDQSQPVANMGEGILFPRDAVSSGLRWLEIPAGGLSKEALKPLWKLQTADASKGGAAADDDALDA